MWLRSAARWGAIGAAVPVLIGLGALVGGIESYGEAWLVFLSMLAVPVFAILGAINGILRFRLGRLPKSQRPDWKWTLLGGLAGFGASRLTSSMEPLDGPQFGMLLTPVWIGIGAVGAQRLRMLRDDLAAVGRALVVAAAAHPLIAIVFVFLPLPNEGSPRIVVLVATVLVGVAYFLFGGNQETLDKAAP